MMDSSSSNVGRKSIDDLRREHVKPAPEKPPPGKPGRPLKIEKTEQEKLIEEYPDAVILSLLKLPFQMAGSVTGYEVDPIPRAIEPPLIDSARVVLKEFGPDLTGKWISVGLFAAIYGTCAFKWWTGLQEYMHTKEGKKLKEKKPSIPPKPEKPDFTSRRPADQANLSEDAQVLLDMGLRPEGKAQ